MVRLGTERVVPCPGDERLGRVSQLMACDACLHRDMKRLVNAENGKFGIADDAGNSVQRRIRFKQRRFRQKDIKLIATIAANDIFASDKISDQRADLAKQAVASDITNLVVHLFNALIEETDSQILFAIFRIFYQAGKVLVQESVAIQTR